jgi:surface polysaccharide O-acyltransferase-like enzyme
MKIRFVEDWNFSGWLRTAFIVVGALLIVLPTKFMESSWLWFGLLLCGLVLTAMGGYASRAHTLGIKPFDNSYRNARESYKTAKDKQDEQK